MSNRNIENKENNESKDIEISLTRHKIDLISGITFSQPVDIFGKVIKLEMDILRPALEEKCPAVVFVTGGGFSQSPKERMIQNRLELAEEGYVVASIQYRTISNGMFPDSVEDVKSAVRFLKANSDLYNIDKERIALMGDSAGGYLVSMAGAANGIKDFDKGENLTENSIVKAVVNIYGITDFERRHEASVADNKENEQLRLSVDMWLGRVKENLGVTNPVKYISENTPPFLLMHGDRDTLVPPFHTEILHEALLKRGIDSTRYVLKGAPHGGEYWIQPEITKIIKKFLYKNLKNI